MGKAEKEKSRHLFSPYSRAPGSSEQAHEPAESRQASQQEGLPIAKSSTPANSGTMRDAELPRPPTTPASSLWAPEYDRPSLTANFIASLTSTTSAPKGSSTSSVVANNGTMSKQSPMVQQSNNKGLGSMSGPQSTPAGAGAATKPTKTNRVPMTKTPAAQGTMNAFSSGLPMNQGGTYPFQPPRQPTYHSPYHQPASSTIPTAQAITRAPTTQTMMPAQTSTQQAARPANSLSPSTIPAASTTENVSPRGGGPSQREIDEYWANNPYGDQRHLFAPGTLPKRF